MLTEDELKQLEATHGEIRHVVGKKDKKTDTHPWEVVLRKPKRPEYKNYRSLASNPKTAADAQETLVRMICVHPPKELTGAFDALLDSFPAIPEACGAAISDLVGIEADEAAKP
jgi:hypothetical protein